MIYATTETAHVYHIYLTDNPVTGPCGHAKRAKPPLMIEDNPYPPRICKSCCRRAWVREQGIVCPSCGGVDIMVSKDRMRPARGKCGECGCSWVAHIEIPEGV